MIVLKLCQTKLCMTRQLCKWNWNCIIVNPVTQAVKSIMEMDLGTQLRTGNPRPGNLRTRSLEAAVLHSSNAISPNSVLHVIIYTLKAAYNKQHYFKLSSDFLSNLLSVLQSQTCTHKSERVCWDLWRMCNLAWRLRVPLLCIAMLTVQWPPSLPYVWA